MAQAVGEIAIGVTADITPLVREMKRGAGAVSGFESRASRLSSSLGRVASASAAMASRLAVVASVLGAAGAAAVAFAKSAAATGDAIGDAAAAAGVSTDYFQEMAFAMGAAADMSREEFGDAMVRLSRTLGEAQQGSKSAIAAFERIGVSAADVASGTVTTQRAMDAYIRTMDGLSDPSIAAAISTDLFGRAGAKMGGQLAGAGDEVAELRDRAKELGVVMSGEAIEAAGKFDEKWRELAASFEAAKMKAAEVLLPFLVDTLLPALTDVVGPAMDIFAKSVVGLGMAFSDGMAVLNEWGSAFKESVGGAIDYVSGKFQALITFLDQIVVKANQVASAITGALTPGSGAWNAGPQSFSGDPRVETGEIMGAAGGMPGAMYGVGTNAVDGFMQGVTDRMEQHRPTMAQMAETLPTAFREILQINSPSVVMQEIGYHAGEGFANGFSQAQSMITTAVNAAGQSIISQSDLTVSGFLSNLQTLFAGSKAIGMAIAAVNIGRGLSEALALPFPASLAAFAKVAAMGAQALATIKGASPGRGSIAGGRGGGGGGGGRSGRGGAASAGGGTSLNLQLLGSNFSEASVRGLISQINKAIENGAVLKSVRVV